MSALLSLAFSGSWLWNDTLIIEPEEGEITYAGSPILTTFPAEFSNRISRLRYVPGEEHIDGVLKNYPVKMIQALNSPSPATIESQNWGPMENLREPYIFGERPWFSFDFQLDPLIEWFSLPEDSRKSGHWPRFLRPSSPETCEWRSTDGPSTSMPSSKCHSNWEVRMDTVATSTLILVSWP